MRVRTIALAFILSVFAISRSLAQNLPSDSLLYSSAAKQVIDQFKTIIADQSELYNGAQYELYPPANRGTFYFLDKNYCVASLVRYNDTWYKNIPVLYDVHNDVMVSISGNNLYTMRSEKVSDVYLLEHHFIYKDADLSNNLVGGFYDLLYGGKSAVLVKRTKKIDESKPTETVYEDITDIYLKKGNKYYPVSSKGDVMDVFKDKKKELNLYLKDNKIKFNNDREGAVARLAGYYDQINK
jgi:hypothetical protein